MESESLSTGLRGKNILITGSARRIGRSFALALAKAGANVIVHTGHDLSLAEQTAAEVTQNGGIAHLVQADLQDPLQAQNLVSQSATWAPLDGLVNNAAIFEPLSLADTTLPAWQKHLDINLTAPFLLSQAFAAQLPPNRTGRIVNILDWRALRPGGDHFPYTISKAALAALTRSLAVALAPKISVNALALGAVLPPSDGNLNPQILDAVPAQRWAELEEVNRSLLFLLTGPEYITGEILYVDGGRHLI